MALNVYRRHRKECEGCHAEDTRTGQFEEGRRGWKKCACLIHVSGTLGGKFNRRQTGTADWDEAKALVALLQQSDAWDGQDKIEAPLTLICILPEPGVIIRSESPRSSGKPDIPCAVPTFIFAAKSRSAVGLVLRLRLRSR